MRSFFKTFFASLAALIVFTILAVILLIGIIAVKLSPTKPALGSRAVLYLDLSTAFQEQGRRDELANLLGKEDAYTPGLFEVDRLIEYARSDSSVKGIMIRCEENANGFASSKELHDALEDFKASGKFVYAFGDQITQKSYCVVGAASRIYCNPVGSVEWTGLSSQVMYFKHTLDKLGIEPQIFYDGKFKSATEPLRSDKMSDANRLQTSEWLGDLNGLLLKATGEGRKIDTAVLSRYQQLGSVQTAFDAQKLGLVDGTRYRDQVLADIKSRAGVTGNSNVNFVSIAKYAQIVDLDSDESNKIALIYAQGDIVYGAGEEGQIGSDEFIKWIRLAEADARVKAIVLRVNSPGGSSLASDLIYRELIQAKKSGKPVVVSMGDLAASGGYYISCGADSIFAEPGTLTGSIGVFSIVPNLQSFFKDKLGVTFDGVKTGPYSDIGTASRPMTEAEKRIFQANVDRTYLEFKTRVANGRHLSLDQVDSIAQGRVWTGERARTIGLVDALGGVQDALDCAARLAHLKQYGLAEYPEAKSVVERYVKGYNYTIRMKAMEEELGPDAYQALLKMRRWKSMVGKVEDRLPYDLDIR